MITKRSSGMLVTIGILAAILFNGCGAGTSGDVPAPAPGQTTAASIDLLVSNQQLDSDMTGTPSVTLTAIVKDSGNRALADKDVSFSADSGIVAVTSGKTDASGKATAALGTGGNPANRVINLSAATGAVSTTNTVTVTGTNLSLSGAQSLSFGDTTPLTIFLKDSKGIGISGKTVTVTSAKGNTLGAATYVTNLSGQVTVNLTGTVGGVDTITASAIGATVQHSLTVNTAILKFLDPPPTVITEIDIETNRTVTVQYMSGTTPQAGVTINFSTTRGGFMPGNQIVAVAVTGADGRAAVTIRSTNSGPGLLQASVASGPTAQTGVEFVAPTVYSLTLQASPTVIGTNSVGLENEKSLITATVRDANNNLVKNKNVIFNIVNDVSGGRLSPASAATDSFGAASTYFIAGASSGGLGGVTVRATVQGTAVTSTTAITVAKKSLFITLQTGPWVIDMPDKIRYQKDYVALVTDSAGNPVAGATVVSTVTPIHYRKGYYVWSDDASRWIQTPTLVALTSTLPGVPACANEDSMLHNPLYDFNGVLDTNPLTGEKEDQNGNNRLDPGNVASVTAVTTDATGHATVSLVYAKDYASWVNVKLEAFANDLKGSTASAYAIFDLPGLASEYTSKTANPPGNPSPFGTSTSCFVDLTVTPISSSQMSLTWQKSVTAVSYRVYRNGIFIANASQNSYFDQGLSHATRYCYQIRTVDATGAETSFTGTVCGLTATLPPSGLTATAISPSQIRLSWSALAGATGYRVYRDPLGDIPGLALRASVVTTTFTDSGLLPSTLYCYAVAGNDAAGGESPKSSQVCATTQLSAPPTPTGLTATGSAGPPPSVTLSWNFSAGAALYRIYRDGGTDGLPSLSVAAPASTVIDTGGTIDLEPKTGYCYTITAVDVSGNESAQSTPVCTSTGGVVPVAPTGLTATVLPGPQVRLNWGAVGGAVGYRVYRNGVAALIASTATVTDITVAASTGYCYAVAALDGAGNESAKSSQVCVVTGAAPPPTPTGLAAQLLAGPQVRLTWGASAGAASYRIYRDGATVPLFTPTATTVTDTSVFGNTTYCYTVAAVSTAGDESAKSDPACVTTAAAPPAAPTNVSATAMSATQIQISWTAAAGATGYRIYRDAAVSALASVNASPYTDAGLTPNTLYCYAVSSFNASSGESVKSAQVCATTQAGGVPLTPTGFTVAPSGVSFDLTWNRMAGAAYYNVYKKTGAAAYVLLRAVAEPAAPPPPATLTTNDAAVVVGTSYCYTVSTVNGVGTESPQTTQICVAP